MFDPEKVQRFTVLGKGAKLIEGPAELIVDRGDATTVVLSGDYNNLLEIYRELTSDKPCRHLWVKDGECLGCGSRVSICVMLVKDWDKGTSGVPIACPIHIPGHTIP